MSRRCTGCGQPIPRRRVPAKRSGRPAHENASPRLRGDMADWLAARDRKPGLLGRLLGAAAHRITGRNTA